MSATREQLVELLREADRRKDKEVALQLMGKIESMDQQEIGSTPANETPTRRIKETVADDGFLMGLQDQAAGLAQLAARIAPDSRAPETVLAGVPRTSRRIDDFINKQELDYEKARESRGETGLDWARIGGNFVSPINVATMGIPIGAATTTGRIAGATAMGAGMGATQPVTREGDYWSDKALQVAVGGGTGAAASVVLPASMSMLRGTIRGGKDLKRFFTRPFTESGRMEDLTKMYQGLAGESRDWLYKVLSDPDEVAAAGNYTFGQKVARANRMAGTAKGKAFVRQEIDLAKKPTTGDEMQGILTEQAAGRAQAVNNILDISDEGLETAIQNRKLATQPLYEKVRESTRRVNTRPVIDSVQKLLRTHSAETRATTPLNKIMNEMRWQGADGNIYLETRTGPLYSLRQEVRSMMNRKTPGGDNEFDIAILGQVKDKLDDALSNADPDFREATKMFKELSKPINKIKTIRYMGDALTNAIGNDTPATFVKAMKDAPKTLKRATGFPRFKNLNQVLDDKEIAVLNQVKEELLDNAEYKRLSAKTSSVYKEIEEGLNASFPNPLLRPIMVLNAAMRRIAKHMGADYEKLAIKVHKNPDLVIDMMKKPPEDKERKMMWDLINRTLAMVPAREQAREGASE